MSNLPSDVENGLNDLLRDVALLRRGVFLAEAREKYPSYRMELQAVLQMVDILPRRIESLVRKAAGATAGPATTTEGVRDG